MQSVEQPRESWRSRAVVLRDRLIDSPTDVASLAAFRVLFGLLMAAGSFMLWDLATSVVRHADALDTPRRCPIANDPTLGHNAPLT